MCAGASTTVGPSVFKIEVAHGVDGFGVRSKQHRSRIHQIFPDHDLHRLLCTERSHSLAKCNFAHRHHLCEVDLDGSVELELIRQASGSVGRGIAVLEIEITEGDLDRLGANPTVGVRRRLAFCDSGSWLCPEPKQYRPATRKMHSSWEGLQRLNETDNDRNEANAGMSAKGHEQTSRHICVIVRYSPQRTFISAVCTSARGPWKEIVTTSGNNRLI
jgi:hypothetical protein